MSKTDRVAALAAWWQSLDHTLRAQPNLKPDVQDARAYPVFFRQLAAQWKQCRGAAFMAVEANRAGLVREGQKLAESLKVWLDEAVATVFEGEEGIAEDDHLKFVTTTIGEPIRPLFEKWMNHWYRRFEDFKAALARGIFRTSLK